MQRVGTPCACLANFSSTALWLHKCDTTFWGCRHITRAFIYMHHHVARLSSLPDANPSSLFEMLHSNTCGKHRSEKNMAAARGGWVWINTFISTNVHLRSEPQCVSVCLWMFTLEATVSYCIHYFTSCQTIRKSLKWAGRNQTSMDSNVMRDGNFVGMSFGCFGWKCGLCW